MGSVRLLVGWLAVLTDATKAGVMDELSKHRLAKELLDALFDAPKVERTEMPDKLLLSMRDVAQILSLGHAKVEQLVYSGELRSIKVDGSRRILAEAVKEYITQLDRDQNRVYWSTKSEALSPRKLNAS